MSALILMATFSVFVLPPFSSIFESSVSLSALRISVSTWSVSVHLMRFALLLPITKPTFWYGMLISIVSLFRSLFLLAIGDWFLGLFCGGGWLSLVTVVLFLIALSVVLWMQSAIRSLATPCRLRCSSSCIVSAVLRALKEVSRYLAIWVFVVLSAMHHVVDDFNREVRFSVGFK